MWTGFTDGTISAGNGGLELKRFSVLDGAGVALAKAAGMRVAIVSGRYSPATEERARELGLADDCYQGQLDKVAVLKELKRRYGFEDYEAAYVGDDIIDLEIMKRVGLPVAVANGHPMVKAVARFTTRARGGEGAFREAVEVILEGKEIYESTVEKLQQEISLDG
ncbi:MAG: KdsC family phosphatase [Fidelibacterota bacterium]